MSEMNDDKMAFFEHLEAEYFSLTYDDVIVRPRSNPGNPLPEQLDLSSHFSRNVGMNIPFVSAAMNTVTEGEMAIAMAKMGGIGVIHCAQPIDQQKEQARKVKNAVRGFIDNPIMITAGRTLESVRNEIEQRNLHFDTFPVVDREGRLQGVLAGADFEYAPSLQQRVGRAMTHASQLVRADTGTTIEQAHAMMRKHKISMLPLTDPLTNAVTGLYLWKDVKRLVEEDGSMHNLDDQNRLMVAIAVSTRGDAVERVAEQQRYVDAVVIDSSDGGADHAFVEFEKLKENFPNLDIVAGNIADPEAALAFAEREADGIKVGVGPGAICNTRDETGVGLAQVTAVFEAFRAVEKYGIPVIADGGIVKRGDIGKAIASGAHSVMMGKMFAGTDEAPGEVLTLTGNRRVKPYNGMGTLKNIIASGRYPVSGTVAILPQGVPSQEAYKGSVEKVIGLCMESLISTMRLAKNPNLDSLRHDTTMTRMTPAGLRESHPHDVEITSGA